MNSKVDVLAVMDGRVASLTCLQDDARLEGNDHLADELEEGELLEWREARAAVAGLIAANKAVTAALSAPGAPTKTERDEMIACLTAALARVTGA